MVMILLRYQKLLASSHSLKKARRKKTFPPPPPKKWIMKFIACRAKAEEVTEEPPKNRGN
jgi:hypothetical protein